MFALWLVLVSSSFIFGSLGHDYAKRHGLNVYWWTIGGILLNVVGLALFFIIGKSARAKAYLK
ncbi:MAG: hypothetical protein P4M11_07945 [Candidatus Pacebacteria bacterium]|nr:hypothetical protein [Candidatus Paceibacterota bacterium]